MKLNKITQCLPEIDPAIGADLIISCCGYEERCTSLMQFYGMSIRDVQYKKAITFNAPEGDALRKHRQEFDGFNFELVEVCSNEEFVKRIQTIDHLFKEIKLMDRATILVDYSSMNREWYSAILLYIEKYMIGACKSIECRFYYRIPLYDGKKDENYAFSNIYPLRGFANFSIPDKPLALIVGLGSEEKALSGIWQYADVDPNYVHYYYTNNEHIFNLTSNYKTLFGRIKDSNKHEYRLDRMVPLFNSLCDLYSLLSENNRVAIISCGPKPFTLMSLVFAKLYNVDVWKLETNVSDHVIQKVASNYSITLSFEYR